jgi:predicted esterase
MLRKIYFIFLLSACVIINAYGQKTVRYLNDGPVIDGYADTLLLDLKLNYFNTLEKSSDKNQDVTAGYKIAYNEKFLYLFIEAGADSITLRDRGYQNGDGFHLVVGKPQDNMAPTDEFYVLAFSAGDSWSHQMKWYYNIDLSMSRLSNDVRFETGSRNGTISFELLLPWKEVYPYHPWFSDSIGFNLCFVKAIDQKEKNYYFLKADDKIQNEQSKREYEILNFEKPHPSYARYSSMLLKNNLGEDEKPVVKIAGFSKADTAKHISLSIVSGENALASSYNTEVKFPAGFSEKEIPVDGKKLFPGGYKVKVFCGDEQTGEHFLTVFPTMNTNDFKAALLAEKTSISDGTYNTMMFYIEDAEASMKKLKSYECSFGLRNKLAEIENYLNALREGTDLLVKKKGVYRRAYRSETGNSLNPYSVYVPDDYSGEREYPLIVYLHGSGDDDRALDKTPVIPGGFIVVAPNGRGTSNCYSGEEPQEDIEEAISDVVKNFNIDTTKIILSGFSMGGYGVYRTYYEHPERYKAIAVISGHPNLARSWIGPDEPDFLEDKYLRKFNDIPIFIFHGTGDMNCPYELTEQVVKKLQKSGCDVTFEMDPGGHGNMNPESRTKYYEWLMRQAE